jgi:hypothetical protein
VNYQSRTQKTTNINPEQSDNQMSANRIMTPAEIQKAAADKNNKIRAVEIQLREQAKGWFTKSKQTTFTRINDKLITHAIANTDQVKFGVWSAQYDTEFLLKPPVNVMNYDAATKIIMDESHKQCNLIGEFVKAQGHNLVAVKATSQTDYGITDIECEFTFAQPTPANGNRGMTPFGFSN